MSDEATIAEIKAQAIALRHQAQRLGVVVTISLEPLQPLRMGNYEMVVDVRKARGQQ